jgi:hypothetical protein
MTKWLAVLNLDTSEIESASDMEDELRDNLEKNEVAYSVRVLSVKVVEVKSDTEEKQ